MMTELRGGGGSEGVKKTIEDMGFLMNAAQGMQSLAGGGGGSGWAEALGGIAQSIFGNPRMNQVMANAIQARTGGVVTPAGGTTRTLPAGNPQEAAVIRERQRVHAQRVQLQQVDSLPF